MTTTLERQTSSGVAWSLAGRAGQQTGSFLISVVLARLLPPDAFGLIAMVAVFSQFAVTLVDSGLGDALIQKNDLNDKHIQSALALNLSIGAALFAIFWSSSHQLAQFYNTPVLESIAKLLAWNFLLGAPSVVPLALIRKRMRFKELAFIEFIVPLVGGIAAVVLALAGAGIWSLAVSSVVATGLRTVALWAACPYKPRVAVDFTALKELIRFGSGLLGFNVINYWARNLDNLLIGRILGSFSLGLYARAYFLMLLPITQITSVVSIAMLPALATVGRDTIRFKRIYLRTMGVMALAAFPLVMGLFTVADSLIPFLYGNQWNGTTPIVRILCVAGLLQVLCNPVGWIYTIQERTDLMWWWGVVGAGTIVIGIAIGAAIGTLESISISYVIVVILQFYSCLAIPGRLIGMTVSDVLRKVSGVFGCAFTMAGLVYLIGLRLHDSPHGVVLAIQISAGVVIYLALIRVFNLASYHDVLHSVSRQLRGDAGSVRPAPPAREDLFLEPKPCLHHPVQS